MQRYIMQRYIRKIFAPLGLALIGFGVSVTAHAAELRIAKAPFWRWFWQGTVGLVILNSGVAFFGEAVKRQVLDELGRTGGK